MYKTAECETGYTFIEREEGEIEHLSTKLLMYWLWEDQDLLVSKGISLRQQLTQNLVPNV